MSLGFKKFLIILAVVVPLVSFAVVPVRVYAAETTSDTQKLYDAYGTQCYIGAALVNSDISGCPAQWVYKLIYRPSALFLSGAGYIFDAILAMSINKDFIDKDFVKDIWVVIRDFSNMIFIFILLFTGIQTMFGIGNWKATVLKVVVLALIVNFSLFFTKVVIDAGNILAVGVYQGVGAEKVEGKEPIYTKSKTVPEHNISGSFANAFTPQRFLAKTSSNSTDPITIFLIATVVNIAAALVFLRAALVFMGRIIAFWFLMIISPFALVSMALPKGNIFQDWLDSLLNQAFVAPLFLFLLYIIMTAMNISGGIIGDTISEESIGFKSYVFDSLFVPIVIAGMIIYALNYTVKIAKNMSGDFGNLGAKALTTVLSAAPVGMVANVALGGGAGILRATVGQGAGKLLQSGGRLNKMATGSGITGLIGRGLYGATEKAHKGTFDVRATGIAKSGLGALKAEGVGINLGQADKAGWDKIQKQREKDAKDRAKKHEVSDAEKETKAGEINPQYKYAKARQEDEYQKERAATVVHQEAQKRAYETEEGKLVKSVEVKVAEAKPRVAAAENKVKEAKDSRSGLKMEGDRLAKRIERLNEEQKEAVKNGTLGTAEALENEIKQAEEAKKVLDKALKDSIDVAEKELEDANSEVETIKKELEDAQTALDATKEGAELKKAEEVLKTTAGKLKVTREIIKNTEEDLANWEQSENERRRERIGRVETFGRLYYSKKDRESFVKTVRDEKKKKSAKERKEDKEKDDVLKNITKLMAKKEKEEGGGKESEKKEKPAEEGGEKK